MSIARLLGGAATAGVAAGAYAVLVEPRWFALRRVTAPVLRGQPADPLRLLHLSDLHLQPRRQPGLERFLARCLEEDPDVVVVTGDIVGHPEAIAPAVDLLSAAAAGRGALFVLGSNDRFGPTPKNPLRYFRRRAPKPPGGQPLDTAALVGGLERAGWRQLDNRRTRLPTRAGPVEAVGLGDAHIGDDRPERVDWSPVPADTVLALGVTHAPYQRALDRMDSAGLDLALAGHTHGGQVRLPGVGALVDNCDLPLRQARGLTGYGAGLALHVSAGLGASRYAPFRFACRPEATLLELVGRDGGRSAL